MSTLYKTSRVEWQAMDGKRDWLKSICLKGWRNLLPHRMAVFILCDCCKKPTPGNLASEQAFRGEETKESLLVGWVGSNGKQAVGFA